MATVRLIGPFPFDPASPGASAQASLRSSLSATGTGPGLYKAVRDNASGQPELLGFWLTVGVWYLESGPTEADRVPPFFGRILDALVEEVWWERLPVVSASRGVFRPRLVIEWTADLAARSARPPRGVPASEATRGESSVSADGGWLRPRRATAVEPEEVPTESSSYSERGLLMIAVGELSHSRGQHQGAYALGTLPGTESETLSWEALWEEPLEVPKSRELGPGVELSRPGAIAFLLPGWLSRGLEVVPSDPSSAERGVLTDRDIKNPWARQMTSAVGMTVAVLLPTLLLSFIVQAFSRPRAADAPVRDLPSAQPAISVCSPSHARFMEELRCQILAASSGSAPEVPVCGDLGQNGAVAGGAPTYEGDVQAEVCGLIDRAADGSTYDVYLDGKKRSFDTAEFVAAQACFDVLGHPDPYRLQTAGGQDLQRVLVNPDAILVDANLAIKPLSGLMYGLRSACDFYRPVVESRIAGAILATAVGLPQDDVRVKEPAALRGAVVDIAVSGLSEAGGVCAREGARSGPGAASYGAVCATPSPLLPPTDEPGWIGLGAGSDAADRDDVAGNDIVARYGVARFGGVRPGPALWACDQELRAGGSGISPVTLWQVQLPPLHGYDVGAGIVRSHLELDATILASRQLKASDACWEVVIDQLQSYTPVFPLLGEANGDAELSVEQQICGQVCSVGYGLAQGGAGWLTPEADLALCVDSRVSSPPADPTALDRLTLPWRGEEPAPASQNEVCAFNMAAQGLIGPDKSVLIDDSDPMAWAGVTESGSGRAGGKTALAVVAAEALSTYGRTRSRETCASVATQCFASLMLQTSPRITSEDRHQWEQRFDAQIATLLTGDRVENPWCDRIQPHLAEPGVLPEGKLDYPCALGIREAETAMRGALQLATSGGRPKEQE